MLHKTFGSYRLVYNLLLDAKIKALECNDKLTTFDLIKRLPAMKKSFLNVEAIQNLKVNITQDNHIKH